MFNPYLNVFMLNPSQMCPYSTLLMYPDKNDIIFLNCNSKFLEV